MRGVVPMLRLCALFACLLAPGALAQQIDRTLTIGTRVAPPFAMKTDEGAWEGISIALLERLSARANFEYRLREVTLPEMIDGVAAGRLDASIAAMSITAERERVVDFSHPFYRTGLGVAVGAVQHPGFRAIVDVLTSSNFLATLGILAVLLLTVGGLIWVVERRRNPRQFEPDAPHGLFSGVWWAAVTMSTVGYGDKTPLTPLGRILGMVWMFAALILTAVFTAQLTAGLTSTTLNAPVRTVGDLPRLRVGNLTASASAGPLQTLGVRPVGYDTVAAGLQALADREIEAFVHDAAILRWEVGAVNDVTVTGLEFAPQDYGIVLPQDTPFREEVNRALLDILGSDDWRAIERRYLGE